MKLLSLSFVLVSLPPPAVFESVLLLLLWLWLWLWLWLLPLPLLSPLPLPLLLPMPLPLPLLSPPSALASAPGIRRVSSDIILRLRRPPKTVTVFPSATLLATVLPSRPSSPSPRQS